MRAPPCSLRGERARASSLATVAAGKARAISGAMVDADTERAV
jgi:hypothetical protein